MKVRYAQFRHLIDIDALEAAIDFVPIRHDRGNDIGHCLFPENHSHGDSTGKFAIHREKGVWGCWVCGGGDFVSLAMQLYDMDSEEAVRWLYQFATPDARGDGEFQDYLLEMLEDTKERVDTLPYFNPHVLKRFDGPKDYFHTRGISDEVVEQYQLCAHPHIMKPAPLRGNEKIDTDYFGPVVVFPHLWQGQLVGWQHRWLDWDEAHTKVPKWLAKYTNTTSFPKKVTVFNYDQAVLTKRRVVVVESVVTVLFLVSHGIPAISYFGSQPTDAQLRLLRRFSQGVILAPDNDSIGDKFVRKTGDYLERYIPVYEGAKVGGPKDDLAIYAEAKDPRGHLENYLENRVKPYGIDL